MEKEIGIWIDHRKAVIVTIENNIVVTREITSNVEKHVRYSGGDHEKSSNDFSGSNEEDNQDRKYGDHLNQYYDVVISLIRDAKSIWIFGPGEGKVELENRLQKAELGARVVGIFPADKLTTPQIIARVRAQCLL